MDSGRRRRPLEHAEPDLARPQARREKITISARRNTQHPHRVAQCGPTPLSAHHTKGSPMEAERSNAIRSQLEDLTTRVVELRRYL